MTSAAAKAVIRAALAVQGTRCSARSTRYCRCGLRRHDRDYGRYGKANGASDHDLAKGLTARKAIGFRIRDRSIEKALFSQLAQTMPDEGDITDSEDQRQFIGRALTITGTPQGGGAGIQTMNTVRGGVVDDDVVLDLALDQAISARPGRPGSH